MKVEISRHTSGEDMLEIIASVIQYFELNGAETFKGNIYINAYDEDDRQLGVMDSKSLNYVNELPSPLNRPLDVPHIPHGHPDFKNYEYDSVIERLGDIKFITPNDRSKLKSRGKSTAKRMAKNPNHERRMLELEAKKEAERVFNEKAEAFRDFIIEQKNLKGLLKGDIAKVIASTAAVTSRVQLLKYFKGDPTKIPEEGFVYRASIKESGKVAKVELYTPDHQLICILDV